MQITLMEPMNLWGRVGHFRLIAELRMREKNVSPPRCLIQVDNRSLAAGSKETK